MINRKESDSKYRNSEKGRATMARYLASENGKRERSSRKKTPRERFAVHKGHAKSRGVDWEFTFESWWAMWEPHWEMRGKAADQMQMCRRGDKGPYSPENCRIDTCANNTKESHKTRRAS